jgi:peptidoglycan/LPS O-acetylase OafA/YrhL
MKNKQKLDQLTSLRFFAALMIVFHHAEGLFGIGHSPVNLGQGVSFFFVLSGFILAYVYPQLSSGSEVRGFFVARIARIWPAYLATLLFAFATQPFVWSHASGFATLAMVQAWLPLSVFYFSYNAAAWSISTEAFFYLVFPVLIHKWASTWHIKLVIVAVLLLLLMGASNALHLPDYGNPYSGNDGWKATVHGLIYINPLARLLEFVTGMVLAHLWSGKKAPHALWTVAEIGALLLCAAAMFYTARLVGPARQLMGDAGAMWMMHSGSILAFALLIFVMAHGAGAISRLLALKPFVILGEISFAMYLLHQTLFSIWRAHAWPQGALGMLAFASALLALSLLTWLLIEKPGRRAILALRGRLLPASAKRPLRAT